MGYLSIKYLNLLIFLLETKLSYLSLTVSDECQIEIQNV